MFWHTLKVGWSRPGLIFDAELRERKKLMGLLSYGHAMFNELVFLFCFIFTGVVIGLKHSSKSCRVNNHSAWTSPTQASSPSACTRNHPANHHNYTRSVGESGDQSQMLLGHSPCDSDRPRLTLSSLNCTAEVTTASPGGRWENHRKFTHSSSKHLRRGSHTCRAPS